MNERRTEAVNEGETSTTEASLEQNLAAARDEHVVPGREIHMRDMRGSQFCEVGLITGTSQATVIANIWNSTGACDQTPEQFDALDADTIDRLDVWEAGDDKTFGGIIGTWVGAAEAATMLHATVQDSYYPAYVYRNDTLTYSKGSQVYVLDAPDGEVFVMQSFTRHWDPALNEDNLAHLASRLDLPSGWGFRAEMLDRDMEVSTASHDNLAHVVQDNLHNVYQGSDVARAFSELCGKDSLW